MAATKLTGTQEVDVNVAFVDRKGKPATVETTEWTSSDETVATVVPDPNDPLKAIVKAAGPDGQTTISANGDANLQPGAENVRNVTATLDIIVGPGEAVGATVAAGTPREQQE